MARRNEGVKGNLDLGELGFSPPVNPLLWLIHEVLALPRRGAGDFFREGGVGEELVEERFVTARGLVQVEDGRGGFLGWGWDGLSGLPSSAEETISTAPPVK